MASVEARDVSVRYPVLNSSARSLKHQFLSRTTGGLISSSSSSVVEVQALDRVSFTLAAGDRVGLLGHNGSGKSTLLRVIAGIYHPTLGTLTSSGRIAALFDTSFGMDPDATGYENIVLRGLFLGLSRAEIDRQAEEIGEFTELGEFLDMPLRTYSSGMSARLAFAISTAVDADILVIDEGIGAGDAGFLAKANARLESFIGRAPIVVIASHDPHLMQQFCTRGLLLKRGQLLYDGPIMEAYAQYDEVVGAAVA
jgi:ABC-2 type transport system ATP-binding protein